MVLHQFQLSYLRQQRDYTNKRKTYVVLLQLDEDFFYVSPISGRGSNRSSPQLSGGAVGLKTIILHFDHGASFGFHGMWLWCWPDTSQRSREHSAFEDERQRRRTWIAWEVEGRQGSFMIFKQCNGWRSGLFLIKLKRRPRVSPIHTTWYLYSKHISGP